MNIFKEFHSFGETAKNDLQSKDWYEIFTTMFAMLSFSLLMIPVLIYAYILILIDFIQSLRGKR
jgi:hypothetical protein